MKRFMLLITVLLLMVACGDVSETNDTNKDIDNTKDEIETISSNEVDVLLFDNEYITIVLQQVNHGRTLDSVTDYVSLMIKIENKQNRTYEMYLKELSVDGSKLNNVWLDDDEIQPNEILDTIMNGYDHDELTVQEHISGTIILNDYDGNRHEIEFNEYIN